MPRVAALLALLLISLTVVAPAEGDLNANRAVASFRAMQRTFVDRSSGVYREIAGQPMPAHAWPYSQALSAAIAVSRIPHASPAYMRQTDGVLSLLDRYLRPDGAYGAWIGASGDVYYDDNEWIALDLVRWYHVRRKLPMLGRARRIFSLVTRAWDGDATHPCPGGVFWTNAVGNDDRNTVTTAAGALLALGLYEDTHYRTYLDWARRMLGWVASCMWASDGLLADHLANDGTRDERHWSYNQGTAIGAFVLLYRLTGERTALQQAQQLADASLAYFNISADSDEPPFFFAILFRNLLMLDAAADTSRYRAAAQSYADGVWIRLRDGNGLFHFTGSSQPQLLEQAAMVQIYAVLAAGAPTEDL